MTSSDVRVKVEDNYWSLCCDCARFRAPDEDVYVVLSPDFGQSEFNAKRTNDKSPRPTSKGALTFLNITSPLLSHSQLAKNRSGQLLQPVSIYVNCQIFYSTLVRLICLSGTTVFFSIVIGIEVKTNNGK